MRLHVNDWILDSGNFDGVVDFDEVLRDPKRTMRIAPKFDSGDCVHPNEDGYREIATRFPVELLTKFKNGVDIPQSGCTKNVVRWLGWS